MITTRVRARLREGGEQEWLARFSQESPWFVEVAADDGPSYFATADNLFEALRQVRQQLDTEGILLCCNGARANARPSGLLASYGAGFVYLIPVGRPPSRHDIVPLFGPAPASAVVSAKEQDRKWEKITRSRMRRMSALNPAAWWQGLAEGFKGPLVWASETDAEGLTTWQPVFPRRDGIPDAGSQPS